MKKLLMAVFLSCAVSVSMSHAQEESSETQADAGAESTLGTAELTERWGTLTWDTGLKNMIQVVGWGCGAVSDFDLDGDYDEQDAELYGGCVNWEQQQQANQDSSESDTTEECDTEANCPVPY